MTFTNEQTIKTTTSRCPQCGQKVPATVWKTDGEPARVMLTRTCPEHGEATACISSDARFYWLSKGNPKNACGAGCACRAEDGSAAGLLGRNAATDSPGLMEKLSTCLALIEIVDSCNLSCPTCYAASPFGVKERIKETPLEDVQARVQGVIDRKGGIEILQLSGGEPTLHTRFFELLAWALRHPKIDYVLINTNGVRLAHDAAFADQLAKTMQYGKMQLYLQFDGVQEEGQHALRGADLRRTRELAIEHAAAIGLPLTLAMTVTPKTLPYVWEAVAFGLRYEHIRGISFQPMFQTGRFPGQGRVEHRLNTADILLNLVEHSNGMLKFGDFTPLPCGDPNCATIGYLMKVDGQVRSISDFVDFTQVQDFLHDKVRYQLEDLIRCGCESEPLGELLKQFELDERHTFRLFVKPFMDAWSWDEDRIDRCCTHVIRPDGKLDSFCRYYANGGPAVFANGNGAHAEKEPTGCCGGEGCC